MEIKTRDESIANLSEKLSKEQLHKAVTQGYSDVSLSEISRFRGEYAAMFFDSKYSANTVNKLLDAYNKNLLTPNDLIQTIKYTEHNNKNEPYVDDFLGSIENTQVCPSQRRSRSSLIKWAYRFAPARVLIIATILTSLTAWTERWNAARQFLFGTKILQSRFANI